MTETTKDEALAVAQRVAARWKGLTVSARSGEIAILTDRCSGAAFAVRVLGERVYASPINDRAMHDANLLGAVQRAFRAAREVQS